MTAKLEQDIAVIKNQLESIHEKLDYVLPLRTKVIQHGANIKWIMIVGGFFCVSVVTLAAAVISKGP